MFELEEDKPSEYEGWTFRVESYYVNLKGDYTMKNDPFAKKIRLIRVSKEISHTGAYQEAFKMRSEITKVFKYYHPTKIIKW